MSRSRVLVAMSGGVDSSVAAARLVAEGHEVVGVTMRLWGGASDTGCCSAADVDDARRVAHQLGVDHWVFNFADDFDAGVVAPYVADHAAGRTPNPCVACNQRIKFDRLLRRADALGFDAVATGHHARSAPGVGHGRHRLLRGRDRAKDQSYVVHGLGQAQLARLCFPVGEMTKADVRAEAARAGLRTATKPDSQDVCFIGRQEGRASFLGARIPLRPGRVVTTDGREVGTVPAVELVTVGQRRGIGEVDGRGQRRYVVAVDVAAATVVVGDAAELERRELDLVDLRWTGPVGEGPVLAQVSAHGAARPARLDGHRLRWAEPQRRVAPGQSVVLYDLADEEVLAGGVAAG